MWGEGSCYAYAIKMFGNDEVYGRICAVNGMV
jgi:hypothetical protein